MTYFLRNKLPKYFISVIYFLSLLYIVFFARRRKMIIPEGERINIYPLANKWKYLFAYPSRMEDMGRFNFYSDFIGNILLFIPLPLFLLFVLRMTGYKKVILVSIITSIVIETIQYILDIGVADIDDVILNTTGAVAGVLIAMVIKKMKWA